MSKTVDNIGIFIRQIDAAAISDIAVYNGNLLMIPVVKRQPVHILMNRCKNSQTDTGFTQFIPEFSRINSKTAKIINQKPDINPLFGFLQQHFFDSLPDHTITDNKIIQEDTFFCLFQIFNHGIQHFFPQRKIFHAGMTIHIKPFALQKSRNLDFVRMKLLQFFHDFRLMRCIPPHLCFRIPDHNMRFAVSSPTPPHIVKE